MSTSAVRSCPSFSSARLTPAVGVAAVNIGGCPGYWVANSAGQVDSYGSATYHGGLNSPAAHVVGITATADGGGYWLVGANGAVYSFGDAHYYGGANNLHLNGPVLGMAITQDGRGYWLVASDGGIFSYGDARFFGSMGGKHLNQPVDGMAVAPGGAGYWLVASDGGVFTFTSDGFYGSMGGKPLNKPVIGMSGTPDGRGYTLVASDGGVFNFGDSRFYGSLGSAPPATPIVDLSPTPASNGYYLVDQAGQVFGFGPGTRIPAKLAMTVPAIPAAAVGSAYRVTFGAAGGVAPYHWSVSGALPPGITFTGGVLAGTPATAGNYSFKVTLADSENPAQSTTASVIVPVNPPATSLRVTTPSLPTTFVGDDYQATLSAAGGSAPYSWAIASGSLAPGLGLSTAGKITGTPTSAGEFQVAFQVRDTAGRTATASFSLLVTDASNNWSGYAVGTGPFSGARGTFTVPSLTAATEAGEGMAEWVGIDGVDNTNLIQAGVALDPDPGDPSQFTVQPWWEILPAPETPITTMTVNVGDSVTVTIDQVSGAIWQISVVDNTNGQSFTTDQAYAGPADSAEWIVEAPSLEDPTTGTLTQTSMAPYSPAVLFSGLGVFQTAPDAIARIVLIDPNTGQQTSTPSDLNSTGFNVAYGPNVPPAP